MSGKLKRWFRKTPATVVGLVLCILISPAAFADNIVVSYTTLDGEPQINHMQTWILHVETESGVEVEGATIEVEGGMPEHDHGLPTRPRITEELGNGDYKLEGMRFHMSGYWEIVVTVTTDNGASIVTLPLQL